VVNYKLSIPMSMSMVMAISVSIVNVYCHGFLKNFYHICMFLWRCIVVLVFLFTVYDINLIVLLAIYFTNNYDINNDSIRALKVAIIIIVITDNNDKHLYKAMTATAMTMEMAITSSKV